jgi:hypothetical protein
MSEEEFYYSDPSNSTSQTPTASTNGYANGEEQGQEYIYNYEQCPPTGYMYDYGHQYPTTVQQPVEEIPYIIPRPAKKIVWKRPPGYSNYCSRPRKRPAVAKVVDLPPPLIDFHGSNPSSPVNPPANKKAPNKINDKAVVNCYLQDIRKRSESFKTKQRKENICEEDIFERLEKAGYCNVTLRCCLFPTCNRRFVSIQVLAYHVSYAHQQIGDKRHGIQQCYVCGLTFSSGKGKITHMALSHKELASQHERICLMQGPVSLVC